MNSEQRPLNAMDDDCGHRRDMNSPDEQTVSDEIIDSAFDDRQESTSFREQNAGFDFMYEKPRNAQHSRICCPINAGDIDWQQSFDANRHGFVYGQHWFPQNAFIPPNAVNHLPVVRRQRMDPFYVQNADFVENRNSLPLFSQCYAKKSFVKFPTPIIRNDFERRFHSQEKAMYAESSMSDFDSIPFTSNAISLCETTLDAEPLIPTVITDHSSQSSSPPNLVIDDKCSQSSVDASGDLQYRESPDVVCGVCGGPASGKHYAAVTCEGCKGFFRRVVVNRTVYKCTLENKCVITRQNRRKSCRGCRYQKCIAIGMKPELCLRHINLRSIRERQGHCEDEQSWKHILKQIDISYQSTIHSWMSRYYNDLANIPEYIPNSTVSEKRDSLDFSAPMAVIREKYKIHLEMECNTMVSGIGLFRQLSYIDQNAIMKNCIDDLTLMQICKHFNNNEKKIRWPSGHQMGALELNSTRFSPITDKLLKLSQMLYDLKPTLSEYALMTAVRMASANGLKDHFKKIYDEIFKVFKEYSTKYRSNDFKFIEKAMEILHFTKSFSDQFSHILWSKREADPEPEIEEVAKRRCPVIVLKSSEDAE